MKGFKCAWKDEVKALLALGHWPEAASAEVRAHVVGCRGCSELVVVETAMRAAKSEAMARAVPEPAGLVWWRAQLRKRQEAMTRVSRPIWHAQMFAAVVSVCAAFGVGVWQAFHGGWLRTWFQGAQTNANVSTRDNWGLLVVVVAVGVTVLLGGVVVYLTVERE